MANYNFKTGDVVKFDAHGADSKLNHLTGTKAVVVGPLGDKEYDREDVGNMYRVSFVDTAFTTDVFEDEIEIIKSTKRYLYVNVFDREIQTPQFFDTYEEAAAELRKDFLKVAEINDDPIINGVDYSTPGTYFSDDDCEIAPGSAWVNDAANHENWDGNIFEVYI